MTTPRPCPICESQTASAQPDLSQDAWHVVECDACAFTYLGNPPDYQALVEDFAWEKTLAAETERRVAKSGARRRVGQKLRGALRRLRPTRQDKFLQLLGPGKVLDIGCGAGHRMQPPFIPFGIELSVVQAEIADRTMRVHGGYCVHGAGAEAIWDFPEGHFDAVMMHSYLEHEVEVARVLAGSARVLRPGGKVYVRVPNFSSVNRRIQGRKWCGFRWPDHVNYFTPHSLKAAAARAGLDMRIVNRLNLMFDDNIQALLIKPDTRPAQQS